ncbi:helix-turn-helix domain-containing protein [Aurantiacibacter poecillastricola]|uniref:helix-turn-helix domain-containing protein n=1 Tax=Aurantiacibacter poecillastricola TaxID=3064385 RepID=UPI00273FDA0B|nr:DUF4019 domain-containing protein [Aurantiacibacter sp. 219JJ12-13]MDP5261416.1 DUF4019 domain-containing protein [Aurantiacibacter sp. 219JJ12-13]
MSQQLADLTEKEKEALRLLLGGHDAKSSATELGLSVHTINDRLRSARRKLGVTSSREAARIWWDAEGATPKFPAPQQFGMGEGPPAAAVSGHSKPARLGTRTLAWLAGGIAMIALVTVFAMLAFSPANPVAEAPAQSAPAVTSAEDARAEEAARDFLSLVDAQRWEESWEQASPLFQSQVTVEQWAESVTSARGLMGEFVSRELATIQQAENLPGMPTGDYVVTQFSATYANKADAVETVIMRAEDEGPRVIGYFIR